MSTSTRTFMGIFLLALIHALSVGCSKEKPVEKPALTPEVPVEEGRPGATIPATVIPSCGDKDACPEGMECSDQPTTKCTEDGLCPTGGNAKCDEKTKMCIVKRCITRCTHRIGRFRYNDRKLIRHDRVPPDLKHWTWDSPCTAKGSCVIESGECTAKSDEDCKASLSCGWYGECIASEGKCISPDDATCRSARVCMENGQCSNVGGECQATSEEDCKASAQCQQIGWCAVQNTLCRVPKGGKLQGEAFKHHQKNDNAVDGVSHSTKKKEPAPEKPAPEKPAPEKEVPAAE